MVNDREVLRYREQGFMGPFRAMDAEEASRLAATVSREIAGPEQTAVGPLVHCRHLDSRLIYDLCSMPEVLDRAEALLGPDLVLWRSNVWHKAPGAPAVA